MNPNKIKLILSLDFDDEVCDSSDSSSDENDVLIAAEVIQKLSRKKRVCVNNYLEVIANYDDREFIQHFRLNRQVVRELINRYETSTIYLNLTKKANSRALSLSPEKTILVFLWYAGHHSSSFRDVGDRFNVCLRTLYDIIARVCQFLETLAAQVIKWPSNEERLCSKLYFERQKGFPNVIGCLDSTHIKIDKPRQRHTDYCNRKGFYSIILQGVCNERRKFINIFIGYPGSTHDARVFKNSTLYSKLEESHNDFYILGDSAYPLSSYVMTPYRDNGHLRAAENYFNTKLSSSRVYIEHTFGILKQRFRQLYHVKLEGHERICRFIRPCCVLHNFGLDSDLEILNKENNFTEQQPDEYPIAGNSPLGINLRNELCQRLYNLRQCN